MGGRRAGHFSMCAENINPWDKSDDFRKKTSLYITCLVLFIILEDLKLDVVCNTIFRCGKERVKAS